MHDLKLHGKLCLPITLLAILTAGGCSSHTQPIEPVATLASDSSAAPSTAAAPGTQPKTTERERDLVRLSQRHFGFIRVPLARFENTISDLYNSAFGIKPGDYARMLQSKAADERRRGLDGLTAWDRGQGPPYTTLYKDFAKVDGDYMVRATAIRSLNRSRDRSATPLFVHALEDTNVQVRLEACKALIRMPDPASPELLLKIVNRADEDRDVRIAAAEALEHYKTLEVARTLVLMLSDRDFSIAWQSHHSLQTMTGMDFAYDESAWLTYLSGPSNPLG